MPYRNIQWIKLEKRLLNDYRFYTLPEKAQLIYVKLLLMAAETGNKIPKNLYFIKAATRSELDEKEIEKILSQIQLHFPKFKCNKNFYHFSEFKTRHNRVAPREHPWEAEGVANGIALDKNKNKIKKENIEKIRNKYLALKGWREGDFIDYGRYGRTIKILLLKAEDTDLILAGLDWIAGQPYAWTLETLIKKWPDFIKTYNSPEYQADLQAKRKAEEFKQKWGKK